MPVDSCAAFPAYRPAPSCLEAARIFCRDHFPLYSWPEAERSSRQSAVLVILYPDGSDLKMILLVRPKTLRRHPGQIGFPGGARDKGDKTPVDTALREAFEEIGLDGKAIDVVGFLPREFAYGSDFFIVPVLAYWPNEGSPPIKADPVEVEAVLAPSLDDLGLSPELEWKRGQGLDLLYPVFPLGERRLWGVSARIALRLIRLMAGLEGRL
ncbi:MAG: CoA pyrophosphatase [Synergistales bacterium]|jgi:8-oxo-dGTP pyrophosphatase MutT (NUDIX family)|nr:CoA pyrophosphatase [Synergistales bacterium]